MSNRLPDTFFIGVYKAGTTFLRGYFTQHPDIYWTREASYYASVSYDGKGIIYQSNFQQTESCYIDMFEGLATGHVFGKDCDWSTHYLTPGYQFQDSQVHYDQNEIARRLYDANPDAKILIVLRNQISWLRSAYLHHLEKMPARKNSFDDFLKTPLGNMIKKAGNYDQTLVSYKRYFNADKIHVVLLEELIADEKSVLKNLCHFLSVPYAPFMKEKKDRNTGKGIALGRVIRLIYSLRLGSYIKWMPASIRRFGKRILTSRHSDILSTKDIQKLKECYAVSNSRTAIMTKLNLDLFGYPIKLKAI